MRRAAHRDRDARGDCAFSGRSGTGRCSDGVGDARCEWSSNTVRWLAIVCAGALLNGCASQAREKPATPADGAHVAAGVAVGLVWWPANPAHGENALASRVEACLTERIGEVAPEIRVISQRSVRDALFPLLEPATQPDSDAAFGALLARADVHARLVRSGLHYLVGFAGATKQAEPGGFGPLCAGAFGAGGCLGFAWRGETTAFDAALWSLDDGARVRREHAQAEGTSVIPALVVPIPSPARTREEACRDLGTRIAASIRQQEAERPE